MTDSKLPVECFCGDDSIVVYVEKDVITGEFMIRGLRKAIKAKLDYIGDPTKIKIFKRDTNEAAKDPLTTSIVSDGKTYGSCDYELPSLKRVVDEVFRFNCSIQDCLRKSGGRGQVYIIAQKCNAYYDHHVSCVEVLKNQKNICYNGEELSISLLFKSHNDALTFRNCITELSHPPLSLDVRLGLGDAQQDLSGIGIPILEVHYDPIASEPPSRGLGHESISNATTVTPDGPLVKYQMLERPLMSVISLPESCQLVPKPWVPEFRKRHRNFSDTQNHNNRLALYRDGFHNLYDGLCDGAGHITILPYLSKGSLTHHGECSSPCSPHCQVVDETGQTRYRFEVLVTCHTESANKEVESRMKEGSVSISDNQFVSYVYVLDPIEFGQCLEFRAKVVDGDDVPDEFPTKQPNHVFLCDEE